MNPLINRAWLSELTNSANSVRGLLVTEEPVESDIGARMGFSDTHAADH